MDDIRTAALGESLVNYPLVRILIDYTLLKSFSFVNYSLNYSLVRSFSRGEAIED